MPSVPRLPLVPDPLRRARIPREVESVTMPGPEDDPAAGGMTREAVDRIWSSAVSLYRSGIHPAMQVCVRRQGAVVLNRAIGHARGNGPRDPKDAVTEPCTPDTPFCIYSASKALTAFVVHMLDERGALHIGDPVAEYIDGYERHGKDRVTIAQVLAHKAGVPNLPADAFDLDRASDREFMVEVLRDAKPFARPGKLLAYHATSGGYILGEIVHRVTGRDIRAFLAEEVLDPLGFRWTNYGVAPERVGEVALNYVTGPPLLPPASTLLNRALGMPFDRLVEATNDPRFLTAIVPAANVVTNAEELSRFFEIIRRGGELDGHRILEPRTIRRALTEQSYLEIDLSLGFPTRFAYGLMLGARILSLFGRDTEHAFGHLGFTSILAWADPERATSVAVLTSGKAGLYPEMTRWYGLMQRITSEAPKVPRSEFAF